MERVKTITIDQLKPGMFIVGMDQPWYRTPFLTHKRLIRHRSDIDLLRQHGIKEVKIDPSQGLDVEPIQSGDALQPAHEEETVAALQPNHPVKPTPPEKSPQTHDHKEAGAARSALTHENVPPPSHAREQAVAAQETYREATCSMERMFEELEAGHAPQPETLRTVVTNVLSRVLDNRASMLSLLSLQKMKRFDRTLASHALDVCTLSLIVAHDYGVTEGELEALGAGALLHDIGYVRLPRNLYRRNHDLTGQEHTMMQQHPALGLAILRDSQEDRDAVVRIVAEHHECVDGTGFPHKLQGDSLSVLAQLVSLVDVYDGLVSRRGGRPAMLPHDAIRQLFHLGDMGQYAKDLIQTMIGSLGVYPISSLVLLNTGEQAVVVGMNPTHRLKPVVKVITGPQGESYLPPIHVDLGSQRAAATARTITKVLDPLHERVNVAMFLDDIHEEVA
ncbi:MAG: HD-GYP domain-containing protein [Nitrospiraceae bacterium]|nr:MAG: HD-GYP domain-containing protein [Nitrospiraceae bacterium]